MPDYTLTYFDFPGSRGEECRLALHLAGVPFTDRRVTRDEWPAIKAELPFGSVPVLDVAGRGRLTQCNAILSFLGREHGLLPADPWEAAHHEAIMSAVEELRIHLAATGRESDPAAKKAAREAFAVTHLARFGTAMERLLGAGPFIGGEKLSVADLKLYIITRSFLEGGIDFVPGSVFEPYPKLLRTVHAVAAEPRVAAWVSQHTSF
jgi:glutathione S-transferase